MTRQIAVVFGTLCLLILTVAEAASAADEPENAAAEKAGGTVVRVPHKGYHFESGKYFTDGRSSFAIKTLENSSYLERIEVSIDDSAYQAYGGKLILDKEGLHTVRFRAVDPVMNWSPVQVFVIYVDLTPPTTKWMWKGETFSRGADLFVHPTAKVSFSAEDTLSGVSGT